MRPRIIGIAGAIGSGKDTIAGYLAREHGYTRVAFADALKGEVKLRFRRTLLRISAFVGPYEPAPVGPDHESHLMQTPCEDCRIDWLIQHKPPIVRELLQEYGTEVRRKDDNHYWLKRWTERMQHYTWVVVPDVRFENEMDWIRMHSGKVVRVHRPGCTVPEAAHASERALLRVKAWDAEFQNVGTIQDLEEAVAWWLAHP